jgi:hypothetical protein
LAVCSATDGDTIGPQHDAHGVSRHHPQQGEDEQCHEENDDETLRYSSHEEVESKEHVGYPAMPLQSAGGPFVSAALSDAEAMPLRLEIL